MSLLLDALKKSEAERRRGQTPGLDLSAAQPPAAPARRWPGTLPTLLLLLLFLGLGGLVAVRWPFGAHSGPEGPVGPAATPVKARVAATAPEPDSGSPGGAQSEARQAEVKQAAAKQEPASAGVQQAGTGQAGTGQAGTEQAGTEQAGTEQAGTEQAEAQQAEAQQSEAAQSGAAQLEVPQPEALQAARSALARQSGAESQARDGSPGPADDSVPEDAGTGPADDPEPRENFVRPWELPQASRAEFPELDLTVHFYASDPADRFVLINGERFAEGDPVTDQVRLREIRRRGVVVEFGDYLVLVE